MAWLIAYDIANSKRLNKVFKCLKERTRHIQFSIFLEDLSKHEIDLLVKELISIIDVKVDDIRFYKITNIAAIKNLKLLESIYLSY